MDKNKTTEQEKPEEEKTITEKKLETKKPEEKVIQATPPQDEDLLVGNSVTVGSAGVTVYSSTESLDRVIGYTDYILKKHKTFLEKKEKARLLTGIT